MNEFETLKEEHKRILQKEKFFKRYIGYLLRIAAGSVISTILFLYIMDAVNIDLSSLKISQFSLTILAMIPTLIPLSIALLLFTQVKELKKFLKELDSKLKKF